MKPHDLKAALRQQQNAVPESTQTTAIPEVDKTSLEKRIGPLARLSVAFDESRAAKRAMTEINEAVVAAEKRIVLTQTDLYATKICAGLIAAASPSIGALIVKVGTAATAVDQALTNSYGADLFTHQRNLDENRNQVCQLVANGMLAESRANVFINSLEEAAAEDIVRSHQRMQLGKHVNEELTAHAIGHIENTKRRLS